MRLLIADVKPIEVIGMVDLTILDYVVWIDKITGFEVSIGLDCSWRAECQRPVFNGSTQRLPETMIRVLLSKQSPHWYRGEEGLLHTLDLMQ